MADSAPSMENTKDRLLIFWRKHGQTILEWVIIIVVAYFYCASTLLDFNPLQLQQTGEQNNNAIGPLLAEISLSHYGQVPLWNPFMMTGFPMAGDLNDHFWAPLATIPVILWGGINGMKVSVFLAFIIAGLGQWYLAKVCGLKGIFRLWASLTFMLSGGLGLLWRVGWVYLLLGAVWFPWVFASFWSALHKRNRSSLVWCAVTVAMTILPGGGYFPFYLLGTASIVLITAYFTSKPPFRKYMIPRAIIIALLAFGFIAVMLLPIFTGYKLINRVTGPDVVQYGSQPIHYALMNYLISVPEWRDANVLGTTNGWNWFYLGPLSIAALLFLVPAFRFKRYRPALIAMLSLTLFMLLWVANRYFPVKYLYDWIKFLYTLRFPNRLLIIAACPLLIVAALSLQILYMSIRRWAKQFAIYLKDRSKDSLVSFNLKGLVTLSFLLLFIVSARDTYMVNKSVAFGAHSIDLTSIKALKWLKNYDPSLYYVDLGGDLYFWAWDPAAYQLEMPVINDDQVERLASSYKQEADDSPFIASAKYQWLQTNQTPAEGAKLIQEIDGYQLWYYPDALPFAFSIPASGLQAGQKMDHSLATALQVSYQGFNKIKVVADSDGATDLLVVLVSDYPGWRLSVDGKPAKLNPINYYLGADLIPGAHTYLFTFEPPLHQLGLAITLYTIWIALILVVSENVTRSTFTSMRNNLRRKKNNEGN